MINYYLEGGELPSPHGDKVVFTLVGHDGVWRDTPSEMLKKAYELKAAPISNVSLFLYFAL